MVTFSVSEVLSQAWEFAKKHFLMMSVFLIVIYIISATIQNIFGSPDMEEVQEAIKNEDTQQIIKLYSNMAPAAILSGLVSTILSIGILNTAYKIVTGKMEKVNFSGFEMSAAQWVKCVCSQIVYEFIIGIGFVCCFIPGVVFAARLLPVTTCILDDEQLPFLDAFKKSWEITKGHTMSLIGLGIVIAIINIIGVCCCCVGLLFTMSLTYFAEALVFVILNENLRNTYEGQ